MTSKGRPNIKQGKMQSFRLAAGSILLLAKLSEQMGISKASVIELALSELSDKLTE